MLGPNRCSNSLISVFQCMRHSAWYSPLLVLIIPKLHQFWCSAHIHKLSKSKLTGHELKLVNETLVLLPFGRHIMHSDRLHQYSNWHIVPLGMLQSTLSLIPIFTCTLHGATSHMLWTWCATLSAIGFESRGQARGSSHHGCGSRYWLIIPMPNVKVYQPNMDMLVFVCTLVQEQSLCHFGHCEVALVSVPLCSVTCHYATHSTKQWFVPTCGWLLVVATVARTHHQLHNASFTTMVMLPLLALWAEEAICCLFQCWL